MILGIGIDLQDLTEFRRTLDRAGEPYLKRIYTEAEIEYCRSQAEPSQSLAVRFAAKEAAIKAFGLAGESGLKWQDFEVVCEASGKPSLRLSGKAAEWAQSLGLQRLLISLSHTRCTAAAVVIAES